MIEDFTGEVRWPAAFIVAFCLAIWAFNVAADRNDRQEIRIEAVRVCADAPSPKTCAIQLREAVKVIK